MRSYQVRKVREITAMLHEGKIIDEMFSEGYDRFTEYACLESHAARDSSDQFRILRQAEALDGWIDKADIRDLLEALIVCAWSELGHLRMVFYIKLPPDWQRLRSEE